MKADRRNAHDRDLFPISRARQPARCDGRNEFQMVSRDKDGMADTGQTPNAVKHLCGVGMSGSKVCSAIESLAESRGSHKTAPVVVA